MAEVARGQPGQPIQVLPTYICETHAMSQLVAVEILRPQS